jgi:diguanylate cyclase
MAESPAIDSRRVLVIDDNPAIHEDFRKILGRDREADAEADFEAVERKLLGDSPAARARPCFELDSALQGQEGLQRVRESLEAGRPYSLAFVDMRMPPGWDGLETIQRLWAVDPHLQVVICSAHADYDWTEVVATLDHSDRLLVVKKPFEPIEVQQCASALVRKWHNERLVRRQVQTLEEVVVARTEGLEAVNRQLRHLATHDAMTGLPNRVLLDDRLAQGIARAQREGHGLAVAVFDLDRFKLVNDSYGHGTGDELLKEVARRLQGTLRNIDTIARMGGDEFVVILDCLERREDAERLAARAIEALRAPVCVAGVDLHTTASIGFAFYPTDGATMESLLAHADAAMYCAKQRGRNNVQYFAPDMSAAAQAKIRMENDLHDALRLQQLELHYQPKVDTHSGRIHGAEALIRWRHPQRGLVPPGEFIPLAEECGLINDIGTWVVREACRQASAWQRAGHEALRVAVNLSAFQFRNGSLLAIIEQALQDYHLDARLLEVEITESALMSDPEDSVGILESLSRMGVLVSVDDFGTGYSSMSYLRRFPIDKLKIDRSFITELGARPDDASIVKAIVSLAHSLKLKVVAEGVETPAQLELLRSLGCDQYQGFYYSPAVPAAEFAGLLDGSPVDGTGEQDPGLTCSKLSVLRP